MPALVYPTSDFQPFTKILSADVNGKFTAIKTLLNTTGLDYSNLQTANLMYASQLTNQAVITNATGQLTTTAVLPSANGGIGFAYAATTLNASLVVQANSTGSALTLGTVPLSPSDKIFAFYRFG